MRRAPQGFLSLIGRKRTGFSLVELMIVVAIMGCLAAVAIPSLQKSVRRARTSEALMGLRKIFDGSVSYFDRDHTTSTGSVIAPQFPASQARTPGLPPRGMKADPLPTDYTEATWEALSFAVSDPYYYTYQYVSSGIQDEATFRGLAFGDLDGDRVGDCLSGCSYFMRGGTIRAAEVRGFGGVYRYNELD